MLRYLTLKEKKLREEALIAGLVLLVLSKKHRPHQSNKPEAEVSSIQLPAAKRRESERNRLSRFYFKLHSPVLFCLLVSAVLLLHIIPLISSIRTASVHVASRLVPICVTTEAFATDTRSLRSAFLGVGRSTPALTTSAAPPPDSSGVR